MKKSNRKPKAKPHSSVDDDAGWKTVIDFTKIRPGGIPADELIKALKKIKTPRDCSCGAGV